MPETAPCGVCGGQAPSPYLTRSGLAINRCGACGSFYTSPRLDSGERAALYSEKYFRNPIGGEPGYADYLLESPLHLVTAWKRLEEIERRHAAGKLLEIGCAAGLALLLARERGWDVHGLEMSSEMARVARERFGLEVERGDAEGVDLLGTFDVILLDDILEHLSSPREFLRRLPEHLNAGGMLALKTPNAESLSRKLLGKRWFHFKPDEHLHFFDRVSIARLLREAGFARVEVRAAPRMISMSFLKHRLGLRRSPRAAPWLVFPVWTGEMAVYAWR